MADWTGWVAAGVSLIGAGLAYVGARRGTRSEARAVTQSQRDEWGRRFSLAIEMLTSDDPRRRAMGRALLDALFDSDLAQADDRRIAERLLRELVMTRVPPAIAPPADGPPARSPASQALGPQSLDDVDFVEDTGDGRPE